MIMMDKRTYMMKAAVFIVCIMLSGVLFQGKGISAAYVSREDALKYFFEPAADEYSVNENDVITVSFNTNIPADNVSVEYIFTNGCAQIDSYTDKFNEIRVKGNICGTTEIIAEAKVRYYDENGIEAVYVIVARATVTVSYASEYISEDTVYRACGSSAYALSIVNFREGTLEWRSSDNAVAEVDANGMVKPISEGQAEITAVLTRPSGDKESYTCIFHVTNPVISSTGDNLAKNAEMKITVGGTAGHAEWYSSDESVASVYSEVYENEAPEAKVTAYKTGTAVISVNIDGITLSCSITVTDPKVKKDFYVAVKGVKKTIKLTGINNASKVSYSTSDSRVASVDENGVITTKAVGYAAVIVSADGANITVSVNVGKKKGVKAVKNALKAEGAAYSQARRMQKGYYDCSSLVWRSYAPLGIYFGDKHYAPVAANEAKYLVKHKKKIAAKNINELNKLRPGDVLFFKGKPNGRYKNIYHTAIYIGQQGTYHDGQVYTYGKMIHANGSGVAQTNIYNKDNVVVIGRPAG